MDELVEAMIDAGVLRHPRLVAAFRKVDRRHFVPKSQSEIAYHDHPLPLGKGATISQPSTVATMLEWLELAPERVGPSSGWHVLDVGAGSGWTTALLAEIVAPLGEVHGVELISGLRDQGQANLRALGVANAWIHLAGRDLGWPRRGPYDRILVSAAAGRVPGELLGQLKPGGLMVIPINNDLCRVKKGEDCKVSVESRPGYVFVPLKKNRPGLSDRY